MAENAYIYEAIRTARGKATARGGLAGVSPLDLIVKLFEEMVDRTGVDPEAMDDVVIGAARQHFDQGNNLARIAVLMAGWSTSIPGTTISRACASGLESLNVAAARIKAGDASLIAAGGVESLSRVPMFSEQGPLYNDPAVQQRAGGVHMGIAADLVATLLGHERGELDEFGVRTQVRAAEAQHQGRFDRSLVPVQTEGATESFDADEHIRPGTDLAQLELLEPAFEDIGSAGQDAIALGRFPELSSIRHLHTRGTSPSLADGAGLILVGDESASRRVGVTPRARIVGSAVCAVDPVIMLTAGQDAVCAVVRSAGLTMEDIDRFEFAEAFASLCLKFQRELDVDDSRFNVNGGTIAIGHAFGSTGPFLIVNLLDELERCGGRYGIAAISGAAGVGVATLIERVG